MLFLCVLQETLVPQCDPGDTEMVCTWQGKMLNIVFRQLLLLLLLQPWLRSLQRAVQWCSSLLCPAGGDNRLFNSPAQSTDQATTEEEEGPSKLPPYSRLTWHTSTLKTGPVPLFAFSLPERRVWLCVRFPQSCAYTFLICCGWMKKRNLKSHLTLKTSGWKVVWSSFRERSCFWLTLDCGSVFICSLTKDFLSPKFRPVHVMRVKLLCVVFSVYKFKVFYVYLINKTHLSCLRDDPTLWNVHGTLLQGYTWQNHCNYLSPVVSFISHFNTIL